jgi:hypothetical protein
MDKKIAVHTIIPDEIEKYPWAGHLGIKLIEKVMPIIEKSNTTLIFINTRGMAERWYQSLLDVAPELAGAIALHHGSIEMELAALGRRSPAYPKTKGSGHHGKPRPWGGFPTGGYRHSGRFPKRCRKVFTTGGPGGA